MPVVVSPTLLEPRPILARLHETKLFEPFIADGLHGSIAISENNRAVAKDKEIECSTALPNDRDRG
ncbi:hypothetical protein [Nocardia seriolae]|uniref:hypothetical protein n=1 Tax=Nocardia seriolae TaxID=37332 RepID=UPI0004AE4CBE|nr:hypothetical protein [Nocardia seriolae]